MMIEDRRIDWGRRAQWLALIAITLQALIFVPLSARMMLESRTGDAVVICTPLGPKSVHFSADGSVSASPHTHCAICIIAAMSGLEGVAFAMILAMRKRGIARFETLPSAPPRAD